MSRWPIAEEGVALVKDYEGLRLGAYKCPAGIWTIGYGHTAGVKPGDRVSPEAADAILARDLQAVRERVLPLCRVMPNANQLAAMVSLAFNIGEGAFAKSTVLKAHNRGDFPAAGRAFGLWIKATVDGRKVELPGLVSRRMREAALYLKAARDADRTPMPQFLAPEPRLGTSGSVAGSVVAAGAGGLAAAAEVARQASDLAYSAGPIIELVRYVPLAGAVVAAGAIGFVLWWLYRKRQEGRL